MTRLALVFALVLCFALVLSLPGARVQLIDANHCPGAAMVVAEVPGNPPVLHTGDCRWGQHTLHQHNNHSLAASPTTTPCLHLPHPPLSHPPRTHTPPSTLHTHTTLHTQHTLHTHTRLTREMHAHPALQKLLGSCVLVLDTTYCKPEYCFPTQRDTLQYTLGEWVLYSKPAQHIISPASLAERCGLLCSLVSDYAWPCLIVVCRCSQI